MNLLFVTDIHGNARNLRKAAEEASKHADALIIGGDIHPIGGGVKPHDQYRFFTREVARPLLEVGVRIFAIMGNVDWRANLESYREFHPTPVHWLNIEDGKIGEFYLAGVSHVPVTPFLIKDWDALDGDAPLKEGAITKGMVSTVDGLEIKDISQSAPNMAEVLKGIGERMLGKKWILVSHCPPYGTSLDVTYGGVHVGSHALRDFLLSPASPHLSLHGHIHESPDITGKVCERVGRALSCNPGDSRRRLRALLLEIDGKNINYRLLEK